MGGGTVSEKAQPTELYVLDMSKRSYVYKCPTCGFVMSELAMASIRLDLGCPECYTSFSVFLRVPTPKLDDPDS